MPIAAAPLAQRMKSRRNLQRFEPAIECPPRVRNTRSTYSPNVRIVPALRPFERGAAPDTLGSLLPFAAPSTNVRIWHNPDLRRPLGLGSIMATLPTFGAECLVIAAFQTWRREVAKVAS
jgi:hypothetical protein